MDDLIARLEAAKEGSRELDAEIKCLVLGSCGCAATCSRRYTTSLDAALTLIPEGWRVCNMTNPREEEWEVEIVCMRSLLIGRHAHLSLALCITALKAGSQSTLRYHKVPCGSGRGPVVGRAALVRDEKEEKAG